MHPEAMEFLAEAVRSRGLAGAGYVLDVGGRDVNGTPRALFPALAVYVRLDVMPGDGVDVVADAADWAPDRLYDVVLSTECFEHTPRWREVLATMAAATRPGGHLLVTCATDPRPPHSGVDGWGLRPGEHYENVDPGDLDAALGGLDLRREISTNPRGDLYAAAWR